MCISLVNAGRHAWTSALTGPEFPIDFNGASARTVGQQRPQLSGLLDPALASSGLTSACIPPSRLTFFSFLLVLCLFFSVIHNPFAS